MDRRVTTQWRMFTEIREETNKYFPQIMCQLSKVQINSALGLICQIRSMCPTCHPLHPRPESDKNNPNNFHFRHMCRSRGGPHMMVGSWSSDIQTVNVMSQDIYCGHKKGKLEALYVKIWAGAWLENLSIEWD